MPATTVSVCRRQTCCEWLAPMSFFTATAGRGLESSGNRQAMGGGYDYDDESMSVCRIQVRCALR
jgi:hypothetical protein